MKFCIIGCGAMGGSMAKKLAEDHQVNLFDRYAEKVEKLAGEIKAKGFQNMQQAISGCDFVIVSVKPIDIEEAASQMSDHLTQEQIVISVAGGVPLAQLEKLFGQVLTVRAMPNIACAFGKGVIGLVKTENLTDAIREKVQKSLSPLGFIHWIDEDQISGLTALAGCGPAFAFAIIESMIDAGIAMGLTAGLSKQLALEMWEGSLTLMKESGKSPSDLKWQVTSPGGTTIAGILELEDSSVRAGIINTILAAYEKAAGEG